MRTTDFPTVTSVDTMPSTLSIDPSEQPQYSTYMQLMQPSRAALNSNTDYGGL